MDRAEVLAYATALGLDGTMTVAGRTTVDEPAGYGPILDAVFALHAQSLGLSATPDEIADSYRYCVGELLRALTYDIAMPYYANAPDFSVDAPLTNIKFSQTYRQLVAERDRAWSNAAACGYGFHSNVGGFKVNLDFLEPSGAVEYA